MDLYFKIKLYLMIGVPSIIVLIILVSIIYMAIKLAIDKKFKKNCFDCKHYTLNDVSSFGNGCSYKCMKKNRVDSHSMNSDYMFMKCDDFEKEDK